MKPLCRCCVVLFIFPTLFFYRDDLRKPSFLWETRLGNREPVLSQAVALKRNEKENRNKYSVIGGIGRKRCDWESGRFANVFRFDLLERPFHSKHCSCNSLPLLSFARFQKYYIFGLILCWTRDFLFQNLFLLSDVKSFLTVSYFHFAGEINRNCSCFMLLD